MGGKKPSVENLHLISQFSDHGQWGTNTGGVGGSSQAYKPFDSN
jgi:hypothetical protein